MELPLGDLEQLEKDPFDFFPKEDPFWNVVPEDAYSLIGLPANSDVAQYEVDNIGPVSYELHSEHEYQQHASVKQIPVSRAPEQGTSSFYQDLQENAQVLTDPSINNADFDPDQFLAVCSSHQPLPQNQEADPHQEGYSVPSYNGHVIVPRSMTNQEVDIRKQDMTSNSQSICGVADSCEQVKQLPYVLIKKEQLSPKSLEVKMHRTVDVRMEGKPITAYNAIEGAIQSDSCVRPIGPRQPFIPALSGQTPDNTKILLSLLAANSKVEQQTKVDLSSDALAQSSLAKGKDAQQLLHVLGKDLSLSLLNNKSHNAPPQTLQSLLQQASIKNEQIRAPEKVGLKRHLSDPSVQHIDGYIEELKVQQANGALQRAVVTQQQNSSSNCQSPKRVDPLQQVPQIILAPQLVYSNGGTPTTIPVTITQSASIATAPVAPNSRLPIIIDSSSIDNADKIPIKRVRQACIPPEHEVRPKGGGRSNHNEVEKRYRNKINSSLNRLSSLVMGSGKKGTKSNILERAIDKINELKRINKRLQAENNKLRMSLKNLTLQDIIAMTYNAPEDTVGGKRSRKGSYSSGDSISDDQGCVDGEEIPIFDDQDSNNVEELSPGDTSGSESVDSTASFGMQDRTRVGVSVFLVAFMFFSPLRLLFSYHGGPQSTSPHFGGRTLLSVDGNLDIPPIQGSYSSIIVHLILVFFIYLWILLKGEPGIPFCSKQRKYCNRLVIEARAHVSQKKFALAHAKLEECLLLMGRGYPRTPYDLACGFLWHLCCFFMIQSGIMGAFKAIGWRILPGRKSSAQNKEEVEFSCSLASQVYWLLHTMCWIDPSCDVGCVTRTYLWLKAINMAELSGELCSQQLYIKIYGNAAFDVAFTWHFIHCQVVRYLLAQGLMRHRLAPSESPPQAIFLFHSRTCSLLLDRKVVLKPARKTDGIAKVTESCLTEAVAKRFLLQEVRKVLSLFVSREAPNSNWLDMMRTEMSAIEQCFPLSADKRTRTNCSQGFQSFVSWWQSVVRCLYQSCQMSETALLEGVQVLEALKDVRQLGVRRTVSSALLSSILVTLHHKHRGMCIITVEEKMKQLEKHIKALKLESEGSSNGKEEFTELEKLCIMVACELLLSARFKLWEENAVDTVSEAELNQAELSLDFLQYFNYHNLKEKVKSYSMLLRYFSGCNPVEILRDLQYNSWYKGEDREPQNLGRDLLKDSGEASLFVSSSSVLLRHLLAPEDKIRARVKALEKVAEGKENTTLRRACRRVLNGHATRGT